MSLKHLHSDLSALAGPQVNKKIKCLLFSHSFHLVTCYRIGCYAAQIPMVGKLLKPAFEYFIRIVFASDISLRSKIGPGFSIIHGHDIVIGAGVVIGKNCKIFNGVTLGNKDTESGRSSQPHVGDNAVFSTGSKILGGISIGSNVIVGANSVVLIDIPDNTIAVGVPAKIKAKRDAHKN